MTSNLILFAIPIFLVTMGVEFFYGRRKKAKLYRLNDTIANLNIGIGSQLMNAFTRPVLLLVFVYVYENLALMKISQPVAGFVLCFLIFDLLFYWAHRLSHEINFLWAGHVVHHSSEEYNLAVALRQPWFHSVVAFPIFLPIPLLGIDATTFFVVLAIHTLYQYWVHTKLIDRMPKWFELIINPPTHHRVHHGVNPQYLDKNHGGVLIVWDRLFGTFQEEVEPVRYGLVKPLRSWNPIWANLHRYVEMAQLMKQATRWRDKLKVLVAHPAWRPIELGGRQVPPQVVGKKFNKFDLTAGFSGQVLASILFVILLVGSVTYLYAFGLLDWRVQFGLFVVMIGMMYGMARVFSTHLQKPALF